MELMSSLLLCTLVALLPRSLDAKTPSEIDIKVNELKVIGHIPVVRRKVMLGANFPLVSTQTELQTVFTDLKCTKCIDCMERAIKADKKQTHLAINTPNKEDLVNDVIESYHQLKSFRNKRDEADGIEKATLKTSLKKMKTKKRNNITLNKYNIDGKIYALKIEELIPEAAADQNNNTQASTCQVYSVKKHFPCESAEGDLMLSLVKKRANRRSKKQNEKTTTSLTTEKARSLKSKPAKRQADNVQILDHFMTSIEELY